jgi:flagellar hook-associated protein FlgK
MSNIFGIGLSGVLAYKAAITTSGENIVNSNRDNYSQRIVDLAQGLGGNTVEISGTRRIEDDLLRHALQSAITQESGYTTYEKRMEYLENRIHSKETSLVGFAQNFFESVEDLSSTPSDSGVREVFLQKADQLARKFQEQEGFLSTQKNETVKDLDTTVKILNGLSKSLANINSNIRHTREGSNSQFRWMDERDRIIEEMAELTNVSVIEEKGGSFTVYLGSLAEGTPLAQGDKYNFINVSENGSKTQLTLGDKDKNDVNYSVTSGKISGLLSYSSFITATLKTLNRTASMFVNTINATNAQGVNQDNEPGADIFTVDTVSVKAASENRPGAKIDVVVLDYDKFSSKKMQLVVAGDGDFILKNMSGDTLVQGGTQTLRNYGIFPRVRGTLHPGDQFDIVIKDNAASTMKMALTSSRQIATGLSLAVSRDSRNTTETNLEFVSNAVVAAGIDQFFPSVQDIFSNTLLPFAASQPISEGTLGFIPRGTQDLVIRTFDQPDRAVISVTKKELSTLKSVHLVLQGEKNIDFELSDINRNNITALAQGLHENSEMRKWGISIYAERGNIFFTAPGASVFSSIATKNQGENVIEGSVISGKEATDVFIFTRDGAQVAGPPMSRNQMENIMKTDNGFVSGAEYISMSGDTDKKYPNLSVTSLVGAPVTLISKDENNMMSGTLDALWTKNSDQRLLHSVYKAWGGRTVDFSMTTPGGANLTGSLDPDLVNTGLVTDVVKTLKDEINAFGSRTSLLFSDIPELNNDSIDVAWALAGKQATLTVESSGRKFDIKISGSDSTEQDYAMADITITAKDGGDIPIDAGFTDTGALFISTKPNLAPHDLKVVGYPRNTEHLAALGLSDAKRSVAGHDLKIMPKDTSFLVNIGTNQVTIASDSEGKITSSSDLVTVRQVTAKNGDTSFVLESKISLSALSIVSDTTENLQAAAAFGFHIVPGFEMHPEEGAIGLSANIISDAAHENTQKFDISLDIKSATGQEIRFEGGIPEDLIVVTSKPSGSGISAQWNEIKVTEKPNDYALNVRVNQAGDTLEIVDEKTGTLMAKRQIGDADTIYYFQGGAFKLNDKVVSGDTFSVSLRGYRSNDNRNILDILAIAKNPLQGDSSNTDFLDIFLAQAVDMGGRVQIARTSAESSRYALEEVRTQYATVVGVDLDMEAAHIMEYQQAYKASSKVLSVAQEIFSTLLSSI